MEEKRVIKVGQSRRNFGKQSKMKYPKRNEIQKRTMYMPPGRDVNRCRPDEHWKESSMCCERGVSGKRCHGNTGAEVLYTEYFNIGWKQVSLRKSGPKDWKNTMSWKELAGNGKVWTAV